MSDIKHIVSYIPKGKKISHLGKNYYKALSEFYDHYTDLDIDIDDLVESEFKNLLLSDQFVRDIKLFGLEFISSILSDTVSEDITIKNLRKALVDHFDIEYAEDKREYVDVQSSSQSQIALHDFQERIRRKVINLIFNDQKRFLIHMPTGSGKTRTSAEIILDFIRLSSGRALLNEKIKILWIAQSSELCSQAYETLKWIIDNKNTTNIALGHFYGDHEIDEEILDKPAVIFCSIQKLLLNYQKEIWSNIRNDNYLVVVDEAHRSVATQWIKALDFFVSQNNVFLLGLTATPGIGSSSNSSSYSLSTYYHSNKITLTDHLYNEINNPIEYLVERDFLAEIDRVDIDSKITIKDSVNISDSGEFLFSKNTMKDLSVNHARNSTIVNIISEEFRKNKKILVFTCGIEHNRILKALMALNNIPSETVDQSSKDRNSIIDRFKYGDLQILFNFGVLTTGFDAPKTDVCVIARPVASIVMYSQMVGRILRGPKNKGNKRNTLYTIKDNLNHGDYDDLFNSFNQYYK